MFQRRNVLRDSYACWLRLGTDRCWLRFVVLPKELFLTLRVGTTGLVTIRCFIFRRFRRRLPSSALKKNPATVIVARRSVSFWSGLMRGIEYEKPVFLL